MHEDHEEITALAYELMELERLPLPVALDAAALALDDANAYAAQWDRGVAQQADALATFAQQWDRAAGRMRATCRHYKEQPR